MARSKTGCLPRATTSACSFGALPSFLSIRSNHSVWRMFLGCWFGGSARDKESAHSRPRDDASVRQFPRRKRRRGLTYLRNVLPRFAGRSGLHVTAALSSGIREEFCGLANVDFVEFDASLGRRFWYEQSALPRIIRQCGAQVLLSAGNFALRRSPVPADIALAEFDLCLARL